MSRPRSRRGYVSEVSIYGFGGKVIEIVELGPQWKGELSRVHQAKRSDANGDGDIRFINNPNFPPATLELYCRNLSRHRSRPRLRFYASVL